jgi:hypothetical protein
MINIGSSSHVTRLTGSLFSNPIEFSIFGAAEATLESSATTQTAVKSCMLRGIAGYGNE